MACPGLPTLSPSMNSLSSQLDEIAYSLEHHEEALRIKKLIYCACRNYWENDPSVLFFFSLKDLIQELRQANPSVEQLSNSIYRVVKMLNRQNYYSSLAENLIGQLSKIYKDSSSSTQILFVKPKDSSSNLHQLFARIAAELEQGADAIRIKKMVLAVHQDSWENNLEVLNSLSLQQLLLEIFQRNLTHKHLQSAFERIVSGLNKRDLYSSIAERITSAMLIAYELGQDETQVLLPARATNKSARKNGKRGSRSVKADSSASKTLIAAELEPAAEELKTAQPLLSKPNNFFKIRLEIFQYTNPLKAKILLFSLLHHNFTQGEQDWLELKQCSLDDLLQKLIEFKATMTAIESELEAWVTASNDPDANLPTAKAIVRALKIYYEQ